MDDLSRQLEQHIPRLRRYAQALVGDAARADDLVQDCLERAWSKGHLFRPGSNLQAWLFTILHNLHANAARRYNSRPALVALADDFQAPPVRPSQVEAYQVGELKEALNKVSEDQRQVLLMVGMEQMTYEEVAQALGIPIGTVMSRLHRGRERLRELLSAPEAQRSGDRNDGKGSAGF
ncbi:MAG TPA: RNA polymerase sigma factor [bacterium]|nr:RNA polymerase sigma factor [bacterium]